MRRLTALAALMHLAGLSSSFALAQQTDIPLANWTVPPYTTPSGAGYSTMTDQTGPRLFVGLQPCRLLDTRNNLNPLGGGGAFTANQLRSYTLPPYCGIPIGVDAVSLNLTVTNTVAHPFGHLKVWPFNTTEPNVSTLNWTSAGETIANAAIVALSASGGALSIRAGNAGTDLIIDVNGYFSDLLNGGFSLVHETSGGYVLDAVNKSTTCLSECAIRARTSGQGVSGRAIAVSGRAFNQGFYNWGVIGQTIRQTDDAAGVRGSYGAALVMPGYPPHGVRGEGFSGGVVGITGMVPTFVGAGVEGVLITSAGRFEYLAKGFLGTANYGLFAEGNTGAGGTKYFVEPHPTDASKVIRYASLEGPEPGTYFRGRGRFERGLARIRVPEDFRLVTDPEDLTVQVTPIGETATVGVASIGLDEIVVRSSHDGDFYYSVNGMRRTQKQAYGSPIGDGTEYMPRSPAARIPEYLPDEQKRLLIGNGTYSEDGSVNLETARRLGWDRSWAQRTPPSAVPSPGSPDDVPLANWAVPERGPASSGYRTLADATGTRAFIGLQPCRLLDTRNLQNPLGGGGPYAVNETRLYVVPPNCGIHPTTEAVSLNITATNTGPQAFGHIKVWPFGQPEPNVSTLNYPGPGATVANAAIVPLGGSERRLYVKSGNAGADVIIDTNGYFSPTPTSPQGLRIENNSTNPAVWAANTTGIGLSADARQDGIVAESRTAPGAVTAVVGRVQTVGYDSAGVHGVDGQASSTIPRPTYPPHGVRGEGGVGVIGLSQNVAVAGSLLNSSGGVLTEGYLGYLASPNYGILSFTHIGAAGTKYFVEPHPVDASKVIRYASLEGPEPGTYFRGRGRFRRGSARIAVPEDFRMVTDPEGLTVQITPIGGMALVGVIEADLNEIVVRSSRDVEFSYVVNGVRRTQKRTFGSPVGEGTEFVPRIPEAKMPGTWPEEVKRRLIQNGTYRPDGTVNMETARRLGWTRSWEERGRLSAGEEQP